MRKERFIHFLNERWPAAGEKMLNTFAKRLQDTGYATDYGIVAGFDPTAQTAADWAAAPGSNGKPLRRLYRNIFSLQHPDSLNFMGAVAFATPAFQLYDLASMAVAQVWKGSSSLPTVHGCAV